jgi:uncharacterized protein YciI
MPEILHLLMYEYPDDLLERRKPYREGHLAAIERYHAAGRMVIAGAAGDPPDTGLLAFRDRAGLEAFLAEDPYVAGGVVVSHRVVPWTVVTPLPRG